MSYLVHLHQFEGPLGLLLYLIRKEEMDIFDIKVGEITRQYLDYIRLMKELDLEVAGEFVSMAATLIHIKSRMLLPQYNEDGEVVENEDPRKELVQKLLDYQRFQDAAKRLNERPLLNRDLFLRGIQEDFRVDEKEGLIEIEDNAMFALISCYRKVVKKVGKAVHNVKAKVQSIASRIMEIKDRLTVGRRVVMRDLLVEGPQFRVQLLITFLSMLELGRMGFVHLFQSETYGDIHIETQRPIERNVLERVQEFESEDADAIAADIMRKAEKESGLQASWAEADEDDKSQALSGHNAGTDPSENQISFQLAGLTFAESESVGETSELGEFLSSGSDDLAKAENLQFENDLFGAATRTVESATDEEILAAEAELGDPTNHELNVEDFKISDGTNPELEVAPDLESEQDLIATDLADNRVVADATSVVDSET